MMLNRPTTYGAVILLGMSAMTGCLERRETITVTSDGAVKMKLKYKGSAEELNGADAMPSSQSGWEVSRTIEKDGDEERHVLRAKQKFAPGQELPSSFAAPGSGGADLCLSFPTTLRIETRKDGVYYHLRRTYTPRKWGYVRYWHDHFVDDEIEELGEKRREDLTQEEKVRILEAFADIGAHEQIEFARAALQRCDPRLPQDRWLLARRALLEVYEEIDYDAFVKMFESLPEEERDARFDAESDRITQKARLALVSSLQTDAGYDGAQVASFKEAYEAAKRHYEITDETGGHGFEIRVKMPGRIIAHNAPNVDDDAAAVWEFNGEAFRDRPYEIMITSRLQSDPATE